MFNFSGEALKPLTNQTKNKVPTKISSENQESVISVDKKDISRMTVPVEERENFDFRRGWEITGKTINVSVQGRLTEKAEFWKNELRPS